MTMKKIVIMLLLLVSLTGCHNEKPVNPDYVQSQEVSFADAKWRVLFDSMPDSDYVTLISASLVYPDSIFFDDDLLYDPLRFYEGSKLKYADSALKLYLEEELLPAYGSDNLKEVEGYKIRLLTLNDLKKIMPLEDMTDDNELTVYLQNDHNDYSWLISSNEWFWTMEECTDDKPYIVYGESEFDEYNHYSWYILTNYGNIQLTSTGQRTDDGIRIVINVLKSALH